MIHGRPGPRTLLAVTGSTIGSVAHRRGSDESLSLKNPQDPSPTNILGFLPTHPLGTGDGVTETNGDAGASLSFLILGTLRVARAEGPVELGSMQRQVVLAALLLRGGRPFPRDQMIDAIWGRSAPSYALNLLQKHVSLLRRALEPDHAPRGRSTVLSWTEAGYVLAIPEGGLDLDRFEQQARRAHRARAAGDLVTASATMHAALDLWRGPLCDGLDSPLLNAERDRLAEHRIDLVEDRIELDLMLGHSSELVPELRTLVSDYPLRERLRADLMIALHRAGRSAEALAAYQDARQCLLEELGLDPSPEVQRLQEQILAGDRSLILPAPSTSSATRDGAARKPSSAGEAGATTLAAAAPTLIPAQLPNGISDFTGRVSQLDRLHGALAHARASTSSATTIAAIVGSAGVGKTALAVEWGHQVKQQFPDGQLYVNLHGYDPSGNPLEPGEAVRGFLDAFGIDPQVLPVTVAAQTALFRSLIAERRVLMVLDNARDADQIRPLLPGSAGSLVIVTSRHVLTGLIATDGAIAVSVDVLDELEALELLDRRLGTARTAHEPAAVTDIIELCARLPLALAIVCARAVTHPSFSLETLADELRGADGGLDAFEGGDTSSDVRRVFSWSYTRLDAPARRLFRLLGLHPGPHLGVEAAAALAGYDPRARRSVAELSRAHLVEEVAPSRFAFHDLLRAYARELADEEEGRAERDEARRRMLDFYAESANQADRLLNPRRFPELWLDPPQKPAVAPIRDAAGAMTWFSTEHPALLAATHLALQEHHDRVAYQLSWCIATFLDRRGHWHDAEATQLVALQAARRLGDQRGEAYAQRGLARAYTWRRQFDDADRHYQLASQLFEALADKVGWAETHRSMGWALERQGHLDLALRECQSALDLFREAGPDTGLADALNAVGWFEAHRGHCQAALPLCEEALSLHKAIGHRQGEAHTLDSLGFIHEHLGDSMKATDCYTKAIGLWHVIGDRYYEAATLVHLGDAQVTRGQLTEADAAWSRALAILRELGHPESEELHRRLQHLNHQDA